MDLKLTIPFPEDLTREAGWIQLDRYLYFIPRFHLFVEQHQTNELAFGDILRTYHTNPFSETELVHNFEEELTVVDLRETTRSATFSDDLTRQITTTVAGAAKSPFYEVSTEVGTSLERVVRSCVAASIRSSDTVTRREKKTFTVSQRIKSDAQGLQLAVAGYRKYSQKIFLHYIDYLFVEYRSTTFGLRKKKLNLPRPVGAIHSNRIPINMPLFKLSYWDLETESSLLYTETEYQTLPKIARADQVTLEELQENIFLPLPARSERPTLYTLSNIAFPLRWVDRKGPWTREELEKTELEEAEGSAWWYQYVVRSVAQASGEASIAEVRKETSAPTEVTDPEILEWKHMIDLSAIDDIGPRMATLLQAVGVKSKPELALRDPKKLHEKMVEVNNQKHIVDHVPLEREIARWVKLAQKSHRRY